MRKQTLAYALTLGLWATPIFAQERLVMPIPDTYINVMNQTAPTYMDMAEWVVLGETSQNWSEMITRQIFYNIADVTPQDFADQLSKDWSSVCKTAEFMVFRTQAQTKPSFMFYAHCPLNPSFGGVENALFHVIQGDEALYVVQKAWRGMNVGREQVGLWIDYLDGTVVLCHDGSDSPACKDPS